MNFFTSIFIAAVTCIGATALTPQFTATDVPERKGSVSPHGSYWFSSKGQEGSERFMFRSKDKLDYELDLGEMDHRGGHIVWSDDESFFCKFDKPDGHITMASIYQIILEKDRKTFSRIEKIYSTPQPDRYDQFWSFKKWNIEKGTAVLHCRYAVDDTDVPGRRWSECDAEVFIDYRYRK